MTYVVDAEYIFTLFFLMLGPIKLIVPYARMTRMLDRPQLHYLSFQAAGLSTLIAIAGAFAGRTILVKWQIAPPVLMLAAGIIFFLMSLKAVMSDEDRAKAEPADNHSPGVMQVIFPAILTPYGLAAATVLLAASNDINRTLAIIGLLAAVMVINLVAMLLVRPILRIVTPGGMQIASAVLGVLVVAMALRIILESLRALHIVPAM